MIKFESEIMRVDSGLADWLREQAQRRQISIIDAQRWLLQQISKGKGKGK